MHVSCEWLPVLFVRQGVAQPCPFHGSVRLYPPVPFDGKQCVRDTVLPNGTTVKRSQFVMYAIFALGRDTSRWGEDAALFKPERFMTSRRRNAYEYPVFNVSCCIVCTGCVCD